MHIINMLNNFKLHSFIIIVITLLLQLNLTLKNNMKY